MTIQEKGFWHKTKEVSGNLWEDTKTVTEDVWEGTKNMAGGIKDAFIGDDEEELHEEMHYSANTADDNIYGEAEITAEETLKTPRRHTKH